MKDKFNVNQYDDVMLEFSYFYKDGFTYVGEVNDKEGNVVKIVAYSIAEYRDEYTKNMTIRGLMPDYIIVDGVEYNWSEFGE